MIGKQQKKPRPYVAWVKRYVLGMILGPLCAAYGVTALLTGQAFLPGLQGGQLTVTGTNGQGLAVAYIAGGLYLFLRFFVHPLTRLDSTKAQIYLVENLLLIALIGSLVYTLLSVGSVG
jgi:hypothetical protein